MSKCNVITNETDILVVGHGLAGLAAVHAVRDADPDVKVLAVDKASLGYGGKANKGGGHVCFIPKGEEEKYVEYHVRNCGEYLNDQDAIRRYAYATIETMDKWETWGAKFIGRDCALNAHPQSWANYDKYPFLEPYVDFLSMFILESPTNDFHKELRPYI